MGPYAFRDCGDGRVAIKDTGTGEVVLGAGYLEDGDRE